MPALLELLYGTGSLFGTSRAKFDEATSCIRKWPLLHLRDSFVQRWLRGRPEQQTCALDNVDNVVIFVHVLYVLMGRLLSVITAEAGTSHDGWA